jgi:DNA primase
MYSIPSGKTVFPENERRGKGVLSIMRSADDQVERIRDASNIVEVVSDYVRLRHRGRNHIGLCPFHDEKTPSFNVVEDKGIFKCFGCGEAGDVFAFVMKIDGLTFPEALEKLAARAGIEYTRRGGEHRGDDTREQLLAACKDFASHCFRKLRESSGAAALDYLRERGFSEEVLHRFGVGYSPEGKDAFFHSLRTDEYGIYQDAGIIARGENGLYERFHGRIIFPIYDATGRVVAFGGRAMPDTTAKVAKYINSPETPLYHKSKVLYGLFQAKDAVRKNDYAILVEGYADVLMMHQYGFAMTIAASGTSLTAEQLRLLKRYTTNIVLLFDADAAGERAAVRGIELALAAGFDVSVITLPSGDDPDTFLRREGSEAFDRLLASRVTFVDVLSELLQKRMDTNSPEGKAKAVRRLVEIVENTPDPIKRELLVRRIAAKFALSESMLLAEMRKQSAPAPAKQKVVRQQPEPTVKVSRVVPNRTELSILYCFLNDTRLSLDEMIVSGFDINTIDNDLVSTIISYCTLHYENDGRQVTPSEIIEVYRDDADIVDLVTKASVDPMQISSEWDELGSSHEERMRMRIRQSFALLMAASLEQRRKMLSNELKLEPSYQKQEALLAEIAECSRKITALRSFETVSEAASQNDF